MTGSITRLLSFTLFGLRVAVAVTLALLTAYYLELDNPFWAGTSASIVCQPVVGSSFRKGLFRMVGTAAGTTASVVITGLFPQNRVGFLVGMGLWTAACSYGNSVARNFSAYGFALAGYTVAIIAVDAVPQPQDAFRVAVVRASEIAIGITSATLVMGLTDIGRARERLAGSLDAVAADIFTSFSNLLSDPPLGVLDGYERRRSLIARVAALDPIIDQAIGEAPELAWRKSILRDAVYGLFVTLSGWRIVEGRLLGLPEEDARRQAALAMVQLPAAWRESAPVSGVPAHGAHGDQAIDQQDRTAGRELAALDVDKDVSRLVLCQATTHVLLGLAAAANGFALLTDPGRARDVPRPFRAPIADHLPATVNAVRTFIAVESAIAFWVLTEWPTGLTAVTWVAVSVMLFAAQQEKSGEAAFRFALGTLLTACLGAWCKFAVLPNKESPLEFSLVLAAFMVPIAAASASPRHAAYFMATTINFIPMVSPTNIISFDTISFYNNAFSIICGCLGGCLALVLVPPISREVRARRLVELSGKDLRSLGNTRLSIDADHWQQRLYARLVAMPTVDGLRNHGRLVSMLTLGTQVLYLKTLAGPDATGTEIKASLNRLAFDDIRGMLAQLQDVREGVQRHPSTPYNLSIAASIQMIEDAVNHRVIFEDHERSMSIVSLE